MAETKKKIRLKGHETFILREGWITKGLQAVKVDQQLFTKNYGADALGVGTNMAKAIRYWLRESGLIVEPPKEGAHLSKTGEFVCKYDPYVEDDFTLWIMHTNLCCSVDKVSSWYMFFQKLEAEEFTKEELFVMLKQELQDYSGQEDISERSLSDDCNAILSMYVKEKIEDYDPEDKKISPFSYLGLVKRVGNHYKKEQPNLNKLSKAVVLYILQQYFEKKDSVSIDALLKEPELPGRILNLKRVALNDYLDALAADKYIILNRTAGLDMVYKNSKLTPEQVVEAYYTGKISN